MFQENLARAVNNVEGARAAMLIGFDGIPIATVFAQDNTESETLNVIAVEITTMLANLRDGAARSQDLGAVQEVSIVTDRLTAFARLVQDEYLLILAVDPDSDLSKGARALRLIAPWVEENM